MKSSERAAFRTLSSKHQKVLVALEAGWSRREVAKALGCDEACVTRLHAAALRIFAYNQRRLRRNLARIVLACFMGLGAGTGALAAAVESTVQASAWAPPLVGAHGRKREPGRIRFTVPPATLGSLSGRAHS